MNQTTCIYMNYGYTMIYFAIYKLHSTYLQSILGISFINSSLVYILLLVSLILGIVKYLFINYNIFSIVFHTVKMIQLQKGLNTNTK